MAANQINNVDRLFDLLLDIDRNGSHVNVFPVARIRKAALDPAVPGPEVPIAPLARL
jgi:hypothetical protein